MLSKLDATKGLIAANILFFVFSFLVKDTADFFDATFSLYFPLSDDFRLWQIITHMFMHGGPGHILMNMVGLFMFGSVLEKIWGTTRFLVFYFVVGIGASLVYSAVNYVEYRSLAGELAEAGITQSTIEAIGRSENREQLAMAITPQAEEIVKVGIDKVGEVRLILRTAVVGASGAVYGILTAFGILFPNAKLAFIFLPVPVAAKYLIPAILLFDLFSGVTGFSIFGGGVGIAHFAHIGGAVIGFIIMMVFKKQLPAPVYRMPQGA